MWSVLETLRKRRATLFWTFCSLFRRYWGQPERRELQQSRRERTNGSYKSLCGICGQKMADRTNATEHTDWRHGFSWSSGSQVSHQFLTEPDKGTDALPTVIESGKGKERDLDFLPEEKIIASVLSSFSLSLFNVIQDLMSSIHFSIERKRLHHSILPLIHPPNTFRSNITQFQLATVSVLWFPLRVEDDEFFR